MQTDEAFRICQEGYFSAFQLHSHVNFNNSEDIAQSIPAWGTRIERKAFFSRFPDGNGLILDAIYLSIMSPEVIAKLYVLTPEKILGAKNG